DSSVWFSYCGHTSVPLRNAKGSPSAVSSHAAGFAWMTLRRRSARNRGSRKESSSWWLVATRVTLEDSASSAERGMACILLRSHGPVIHQIVDAILPTRDARLLHRCRRKDEPHEVRLAVGASLRVDGDQLRAHGADLHGGLGAAR